MASCCCLLSPGVAREGRGLSDRARTLRASDSPNSGFLPALIRARGRLPSRFLKLEASLQLTGFEGTPKTQSCLDGTRSSVSLIVLRDGVHGHTVIVTCPPYL